VDVCVCVCVCDGNRVNEALRYFSFQSQLD